MNYQTQQELKSLIIDAINDNRLNDKPVNEIHNEVFNTDYFIIGRYDAEKWLNENGGIFNAIETIKDYELNNLNVIQNNWDEDLNEELKAELLEELS